VPLDPAAVYDMRQVVRAIADGGEFLEVQAGFARNLLAGFARLDGRSTGIVANNPAVAGGHLDLDAADKAGEKIVIDAAYVEEHIGDLAKNADLSKFIL